MALAIAVSLFIDWNPTIEISMVAMLLSSWLCSDLAWFFWNKKQWWLLCLLLIFFHVIAVLVLGFVRIFTGDYSAAGASWIFAFEIVGASFFCLLLSPAFAIAAYISKIIIEDSE